MADLTPLDRLKVHLWLYYPKIHVRNIRLHETPGFLIAERGQMIDVTAAGYAEEEPPYRLWNELHGVFREVVEVVKLKNKLPTVIHWHGLVYRLDNQTSFVNDRRCKRESAIIER